MHAESRPSLGWHIDTAVAELLVSSEALKAHPDFAHTKRLQRAGRSSREALTLVNWAWECLESCLQDAPLHEASSWLREDATTMEQTMREAIELEEREALERQERRRA